MLGRLDSGLHLCIFPTWVGMLATCKAEASNTVWRPFGSTSILISGAKRALSSSCFTLLSLPVTNVRLLFRPCPAEAIGWQLEMDSCKLSPNCLEVEMSSFAPFAFRLYNWAVSGNHGTDAAALF